MSPEPPEGAYPRAVYGSDERLLPHAIRNEATNHALLIWVGGLLIRTTRDATDDELRAGVVIGAQLATVGEQHADTCRALLDQRAAARAADAAETAHDAADRPPLTS